MPDQLTSFVTSALSQHPILTLLLAFIGTMDLGAWIFGQFVTFTHKLRLHWRRMQAEPDPDVLKV